jgi:hypothetical protein
MTDHDPNEAYEVVPIEPGPHGPPKGWWTVKRNGLNGGFYVLQTLFPTAAFSHSKKKGPPT